MGRRTIVATIAYVSWVFVGPHGARALELITNGDFETGDFTGWTVTDLAGGSGSFFIDGASGFTPFSSHSTVGPAGGSFYAVSDQTGPGTHVLSQAFTVPPGATSVMLSFDMFANDLSDLGPVDQGLDHTLSPNQHGRVDIMDAGAGAFDTGAGVLSNLFLGVDPGIDPNPYTPYVFDISTAVSGGGTFVLRFAEVDNQGFFNLGVDNVSIVALSVCGDSVVGPGEDCEGGVCCNGSCQFEAPGAPCEDGDVCSNDDTCDGAGTCVGGGAATTCADTWEKGTLLVKENKPGKEKFLAKLIKGPAVDQLDLGSPLASGGSAYTVCVYDDADDLVAQMQVDRAGADCAGRPCWKALGGVPPDGKGYLYKDGEGSAGGIRLLILKGGASGKTKILIKGANNALAGQTDLPTGIAAGLAGSASATVQLHGDDLAQCLSATYDTIKKDSGDSFKAKK